MVRLRWVQLRGSSQGLGLPDHQMGCLFTQNGQTASLKNPTFRWQFRIREREEQIIGTKDKPQWIVAQRLLSHLQYLDATKSSTKDLSNAHGMLRLVGVIFDDWCQPVKSGQAYNFTCNRAHNEKHCLVSMASDLEAFSR